jgi:7-cyano-7-deazaguanine synthase
MPENSALVLFSGGQDSATCLTWALDRFDHVETIGFDYRQRHLTELQARIEFREGLVAAFPAWAAKLGEDRVLDLGVLGDISETALTRDVEIRTAPSGLPNTFVPGRNIIFLTFAAAIAFRRGLKHIVTGVCETDFSGYPDCRDDTVKALQVALNLGMESRFVLETPLMWIDKAQTWRLAKQLGGDTLVELIRARTMTCYQGDTLTQNDWGRGCGKCPACDLRRNGFQAFSAS